jgi:hypothetical protein
LAKLLALPFVLKHIHFLAVNFSCPFSPNEFLSFFGKLSFESLTRFCFNRFGVPLVSNPSLQSFCTQYANGFAKPANPVLILVFPFVQTDSGREGGKEGCEEGGSMFEHGFSRPTCTFQLFTLQQSPFTLQEITIGQDKIYG